MIQLTPDRLHAFTQILLGDHRYSPPYSLTSTTLIGRDDGCNIYIATIVPPSISPRRAAWIFVAIKSQRRPDIRERILDAAFDVIAEPGLDGFTNTEVERRVGLAVGTGSICRHFGSKGELLKATLDGRWTVTAP
jgi:hypothetical protein